MFLTALCLALVRYMTAAGLIASASGWFSGSFSPADCTRLHLVPVILQLIANWGTQGLIVMKTFAISKHDSAVMTVLGLISLFCFPLQIFGTQYLRYSYLSDGRCTSYVHTQQGYYDSGTLYFAANLVFAAIASIISFGFVYSQTLNSPLSSLSSTLVGHGVPYIALTAFVNMLCLLGSLNLPGIRNVGWTLPNAVILIMSQHLALSSFELNALAGSERIPKPRYLDPESGRTKRKNNQIELRGINVQRDTVIRTEAENEEEHGRMSKATFTHGRGRRRSSFTDEGTEDSEKPRRLSDSFEQSSRHDLVLDVTR